MKTIEFPFGSSGCNRIKVTQLKVEDDVALLAFCNPIVYFQYGPSFCFYIIELQYPFSYDSVMDHLFSFKSPFFAFSIRKGFKSPSSFLNNWTFYLHMLNNWIPTGVLLNNWITYAKHCLPFSYAIIFIDNYTYVK